MLRRKNPILREHIGQNFKLLERERDFLRREEVEHERGDGECIVDIARNAMLLEHRDVVREEIYQQH